jgi:hypothetical protein
VAQTHPPDAGVEVDFHDLWVVQHGMETKTALFTMRFPTRRAQSSCVRSVTKKCLGCRRLNLRSPHFRSPN